VGQPVGFALALCTALAACTTKPDAPPGGSTPPATATAPDRFSELAAAIEAIDSVPPVPLHDTAPSRALMPETPDRGPVDPKDVEFALDHWQRQTDVTLAERVPQALLLVNLALTAEVHQPKDDAGRRARLFALERLYGALDRPHAAAVATHPVVDAIAKLEGVAGTPEQNETLVELILVSLKTAGGLHRRTVAEILRKFPDDPQTPAVLDRIAEALQNAERTELARDALDAAASLRGFTEAPKDH
jgi:hypothetical protein